jgi:hypothetical protein
MDQGIAAFLAYVLALADEEPDALSDLLDGFVLTVLIAVAVGRTSYAMSLVKELQRSIRK